MLLSFCSIRTDSVLNACRLLDVKRRFQRVFSEVAERRSYKNLALGKTQKCELQKHLGEVSPKNFAPMNRLLGYISSLCSWSATINKVRNNIFTEGAQTYSLLSFSLTGLQYLVAINQPCNKSGVLRVVVDLSPSYELPAGFESSPYHSKETVYVIKRCVWFRVCVVSIFASLFPNQAAESFIFFRYEMLPVTDFLS
ncbi:hypothetical protein YC2023_095132 [Brassica napus]